MQLLGNTKYKVTLDESRKAEIFPEERRNKEQYARIDGEFGHIYKYSANQLAIWLDGKNVMRRRRKSWKVMQLGDEELTAQIPDSDLDMACNLIKAKKRRQYSPEALEALRQRGKILSKKGGKRG